MVQYKNFKIGDIFEKLSTKYKGTIDKNKAVTKSPSKQTPLNILYAKSGDNGIMYWAKEEDFEAHENTIGIIYNGAIAAGLVYAQKFKTSVLAESYLIRLKNVEVSFAVNLYLAKCIEKVTFKKYSREYLATWNKVKEDQIQLPVDTNGEPNWGYMEKYILDIETKYKDLIFQYLSKYGYSSSNPDLFELNKQDLAILEKHSKAVFKEHSLKKIFDINTGKDFIMMSSQKGDIPVISRSRANNGFGMYSGIVKNQKLFDHEKTITATLIGQIWSTVHNKDFYIGTRVKGLVAKDKSINKAILKYISVAINKVGESYVTYQNKPAEFEAISILLPTLGENLDYNLMEEYIKVIEKKVLLRLINKLKSDYQFLK